MITFSQTKKKNIITVFSVGITNNSFSLFKQNRLPKGPFAYGVELNGKIYRNTSNRFRFGIGIGGSTENYQFVSSYIFDYRKVYLHKLSLYNLNAILVLNCRIITKEKYDLFAEAGINVIDIIKQNIKISRNDSMISTTAIDRGTRIFPGWKKHLSASTIVEIGVVGFKKKKYPMGLSLKYDGIFSSAFYYPPNDGILYRNIFSVKYSFYLK